MVKHNIAVIALKSVYKLKKSKYIISENDSCNGSTFDSCNGSTFQSYIKSEISFRMTLATEAISDLYVVLDKVIMKCDSLPVAQVSYECTYLA